MSNDELKNSTSLTTTGDGFDNYTDQVEGEGKSEQQVALRITQSLRQLRQRLLMCRISVVSA